MELKEQQLGERLLLSASGRLDATWADFFKESLLAHIRSGEHQIVIDAAGLTFLSSLGIRSLMVVYKKLTAVSGSFQIVHAQGMVRDTLNASGLGAWLSDEKIDLDGRDDRDEAPRATECFELSADAMLQVERTAAWRPWQPIEEAMCRRVRFESDCFGIGIGAAGESLQQVRNHLGEFVAAGGQVAVQPPDEHGRPDCLLAEQSFVPELHTVESWVARGSMARVIRFRSSPDVPVFPLSALVAEAVASMAGDTFGIAVIGEIEGLVGAQLIRSPGKLDGTSAASGFPEIKEWLSFCGERSFTRELAVVVGVVSRGSAGHFHAAVFPYQFLPNGPLPFAATARKIFDGPPPRAVMHLVRDDRPGVGIGESAFYHGACWIAPVSTCEAIS